MTSIAYWSIYVLLLLGAVAALTTRRPARWVAGAGTLAGALAVAAGIAVAFGATAPAATLRSGLPFGPLTLSVDPLGALFLVVIGTVSVGVSLSLAGSFGGQTEPPRALLLLLSLLMISLFLIVSAADAAAFVMAWELMAFLSYLAVAVGRQDPEAAHAGYVMLAVSELGTIGIIGALLFLVHAGGGFSFAELRAGSAQLTPGVRDLAFMLALFGFGAKAGLLPLQLWMPSANAAALGPVAALLSGAIEGLGLYGMLRVFIDLLGTGPIWVGLVILSLGAITAFVGILYAFVERDLKRILAYSTIENDGIIIAAIGLTLTFRSAGLPELAAIAGLFALYHLLNHAVYKTLLFLGAGAIDGATGVTDLEHLGGLIRLMPWTAVTFLVGSLSIAAVAPFAGYISEWGILESMLQSFALSSTSAKLVIAGSGAVLALTAALAVTVFLRVFAVGFLAQGRSPGARAAREAPAGLRIAMSVLTVVTLGLGLLPAFVLTGLARVATPLWGSDVLGRVVPPLFTTHPGAYAALDAIGARLFQGLPVNGLVIIAAPELATITSPTYMALAELILVGLVWAAVRLLKPLGLRRRAPVWAGGIPRHLPQMQYGAVAYSNPARIIFNGIYRSTATLVPLTPASRYGPGQIEYNQEVAGPFQRWLYQPLMRALQGLAIRAKVIQSGSVNQYVLYIFAMVLIILVLRAI